MGDVFLDRWFNQLQDRSETKDSVLVQRFHGIVHLGDDAINEKDV
jgi:hypothetical protein